MSIVKTKLSELYLKLRIGSVAMTYHVNESFAGIVLTDEVLFVKFESTILPEEFITTSRYETGNVESRASCHAKAIEVPVVSYSSVGAVSENASGGVVSGGRTISNVSVVEVSELVEESFAITRQNQIPVSMMTVSKVVEGEIEESV